MKKSIQRIISLLLCVCMFAGMAITANAEETAFAATAVVSSDNKTVTVTISAGSEINTDGFQFNYNVPDGWSAKVTLCSTVSSFTVNEGTSYVAYGNDTTTNDLVTIIYTVPEGATGSFDLGVTNLMVSGDGGDVVYANGISVTTNVSIGTSTPTSGYTANMTTSANNNEVVSGSDIKVNVDVSHSADTVFNAGEIKLTYQSTKLIPNATELDKLVDDGTLSGYKVGSNVLTIEGFGGDKTLPYTYSIPFTAADVGVETTDTVTLTRAAFIHKDNASSSDLIEATKSPESLTVTIKVAMVNVTLTNSADSSETTTTTTQKGVDYTFAPTDTANYTYSNVSATVDGDPVTVTPSTDGKSFTIAAAYVIGDIALTYTKTANTYKVTWDGAGKDDIKNKPSSATYGQNLTVTLPDDIAPGTEVGYTYGISAQIVETSVGSYDSTTRTLTISGNDITGDIAITVTKTPVDPTDVTITVSGDSGVTIKGVTGNTATVTIGDTVTLVLTKEEGYDYRVVDSKGKEVTFEDGEYTFKASVTETYTVTKTLNVSSVAVTEYVKVDSYVIWLVTFDGTLAEDKIPTYDGSNMFWSDSYDAYCYLVKETTLDAETAGTKIGAATETATPVDYGMDINGTNVTDAADAQMVWNMYNAEYTEFNTGVEGDKNPTMVQFLAADQNATSENTTWGLNVQDALVIITAILENNATI